MVDGLDEAHENEQKKIVEFLTGIPGQGLTVVSSQSVRALEQWPRRLDMQGESERHADAEALIRGFVTSFAESGQLCLVSASLQLNDPEWMRNLITRSGANLWILKDFLASIQAGLSELPASLAQVPLSDDISEYCERLFKDVLDRVPAAGGEVSASNFEILLTHLAINEAEPWPLPELLRFSLGESESRRIALSEWRNALTEYARRFIDCRLEADELVVSYRDPWFAGFVRERLGHHGLENVLGKLLGLLGTDQSGQFNAIEDYAVSRCASLVLRYAPVLSERLVTETEWTSRRFAQIISDIRGNAALAESSLSEMVSELLELEAAVSGATTIERCAISATRLPCGVGPWSSR